MDVYCRCGEPWSCQGRHYTTTDLSLWDWSLLLRGAGCPCCEGDFTESLARDDQWRRTVTRAFEGEAPAYLFSDPPPIVRWEPRPPLLSMLPDSMQDSLRALTTAVGDLGGSYQLEEVGLELPDDPQLFPGDRPESELRLLFSIPQASYKMGADNLQRTNYDAIREWEGLDNGLEFVGHHHDWGVVIAAVSRQLDEEAELQVSDQDLSQLREGLSDLLEYPVLDEGALDELDEADLQERLNDVVQSIESQLESDLLLRMDGSELQPQIRKQVERALRDDPGSWPDADEVLNVLQPSIPLIGWQVYHAKYCSQTLIVVPSTATGPLYDGLYVRQAYAETPQIERFSGLQPHELGPDAGWFEALPWPVRRELLHVLAAPEILTS